MNYMDRLSIFAAFSTAAFYVVFFGRGVEAIFAAAVVVMLATWHSERSR